MTLRWERGEALASRGDLSAAFAGWLGRGAAAAEASRALGETVPQPAPLFAGAAGARWRSRPAGVDGWDADRLTRAAGGQLEFVVTGQQPGFLGGPALVLAKVATAIATAEARTAAGRPSLAVFWCGDDDDDLAEALGPAGWDPRDDSLVRADGRAAARRSARDRTMIGGMPAARWCTAGAALLAGLAAAPGAGILATDLRELWRAALDDGWSWSDLNVAALRRVFAAHDLAVVRGNDPALQEAATPFYAALGPRRATCRELAGERGRELAAAGLPVPLSERSLRHHLFVASDGRRVVLPEDRPLPAAADLRPGVLLRSLAQDWLLRPAAVVVGPGESAYLEQLEPLYPELAVPRPPRVARLFAWLLPIGTAPSALLGAGGDGAFSADDAAALAVQLGRDAAEGLAVALHARLGLAPDRARTLAVGRARRWQRGLGALLSEEGRRARASRTATLPACLYPDGWPQDRRLAAVAAAAAWGDDLATVLVGAARDHLARGAASSWHQYHVLPTGD